jgi:tetratricopeptide (TPR) repeat protein
VGVWALLGVLGSGGAWAGGLQEEWLNAGRWDAPAMERSPLSNPAFLTRAHFITFRTVLSSLIDKLYIHDIGVVMPLGLRHSAGIGWMTLAADSSVPGVPPIDPDKAAGERYEYEANLVLFSYGFRPLGSVMLGTNLTIAQRELLGFEHNTGFGIDLGAGYDFPPHPITGSHSLALAVQNAVAPRLGSDGALRRVARLSLLSHFRQASIESNIEFAIENPFDTDGDGGRGGWEDRWGVAGRLGYRSSSNINVHVLAGGNAAGNHYAGLGAGFSLPTYVYDKPRNLTLEYQHSRAQGGKANGPSIHLDVEVGKHRLTADVLLHKALASHRQGDYLEALPGFGRVIAEYPNYRGNDKASYYLGACELALGLHEAAAYRFSRLPRHYPGSAMVPAAAVGLMSVHYREGRDDSVGVVYERFMGLIAPDSLKDHAHYLMAQALIRRGEHEKAAGLLEKVSGGHPDYLYARQSLAIARYAAGDTKEARRILQRCIRYTPRNRAERELVNRCRVLLGYLYYERAEEFDSALVKATLVLREVPRRSVYFADALLGLAWTSLEAGQWDDCAAAAHELRRAAHPALRAEGTLLLGYIDYARKQYAEAVAMLEEAERILEENAAALEEPPPSPYPALDSLGMNVDRLVRTRRRPGVRRRIAKVTEELKRAGRRLDKQLARAGRAGRDRFFARHLPTLRDDIQYALAAATYMLHRTGEAPAAGSDRTHKRLDREIRELEHEMRKLEKKE